MNIYIAVLVGYSGVLILMGLWLSRRVKHADDFFVAGRSLNAWLIGATILAANIGAGTTVGAAGIGYARGFSAWWWVGTAGIGTVIVAAWLGPRFWKLGRDNGYLTVGDFLEDRFGPGVRATITGLLWLGTPWLLAAQIMAVAFIFDAVAGVPKVISSVVGGVVMITYFTAGGLVGAAWVNALQLVVLLGGFMLAVPLALSSVGGIDGLMTSARTVSTDYTNFWGASGRNWVFYLALLLPNFMISPGIVQKAYGARNERSIRIGVSVAGGVLLLFAFAPALLGMIAHVRFPGLENAESALPTLLKDGLPAWVGALGLGAIFMAEVSSADAILFMLSTSLSKDLYKRFLVPDANDAQVLRVARLAAIGGGLLSISLALISETIVTALGIFYSIVGVVLFVPLLAALYRDRTRAVEAFAAISFGLSTYLVTRWLVDQPVAGFLTPNLLGLLAAGSAYISTSVLRVRAKGPVPESNSQANV